MNVIKTGIKERDQLYRLIISQLFYDGYQNVAVQLANMTKAHPACPPSDRLLKIVTTGFLNEEEESIILKKDPVASDRGIDLEFETDVQSLSPEAASYETFYVTAHKGPCRAASFHKNGSLIATGSEDTSIKILDVDRMIAKSNMSIDTLTNETPQQQMENHPVIRTLYDHAAEITCLEFHPEQQMLVSGSRDFTVKCFEFSKPSVKKASKVITEAYEIRCLSFHPTGDFLLVGTQHPIIRIYDTTTFQCYVCPNVSSQHAASITSVKYSPNATMFVTSSKDGSIKIWDGVSCKCINTFQRAHDGTEVCSVVFSKNSKYVLSSGKDSLVKLWELSTSRCLIAYTGAGVTGRQEHRSNAIFNHTEDYILFPDEKTSSLCCWDARNADRQRLLSLGHNSFVRCIAHSPVRPAFVSCSDDFRARFWFRKMPSE